MPPSTYLSRSHPPRSFRGADRSRTDPWRPTAAARARSNPVSGPALLTIVLRTAGADENCCRADPGRTAPTLLPVCPAADSLKCASPAVSLQDAASLFSRIHGAEGRSRGGASAPVRPGGQWARRDSNPHPFRDRLLRPERIPVPPLARFRCHLFNVVPPLVPSTPCDQRPAAAYSEPGLTSRTTCAGSANERRAGTARRCSGRNPATAWPSAITSPFSKR